MTLINKIEFSGIIYPRKHYDKETIKIILKNLPAARKRYDEMYPEDVNHDELFYKGSRYYNDSRTIAFLESHFDEEEAKKGRGLSGALRDAANADYYYRFEKDYGVEEVEID